MLKIPDIKIWDPLWSKIEELLNIDMMSQVENSTPKLWWHITAKTHKPQNYSIQLFSAYGYKLNINVKEIYIQVSLPDILGYL